MNLTISSNTSIGDIVRGGNVLGEEAFFDKKPKYRESVRCYTDDAALLRVNAGSLASLGT